MTSTERLRARSAMTKSLVMRRCSRTVMPSGVSESISCEWCRVPDPEAVSEEGRDVDVSVSSEPFGFNYCDIVHPVHPECLQLTVSSVACKVPPLLRLFQEMRLYFLVDHLVTVTDEGVVEFYRVAVADSMKHS